MILLFGAAVFVHEFGHYWVARRRGMKVEEFAIGFGPKILSWTRDGVLYSWRWIPAGGFVKLPQMITSEAMEGSSGAVDIPPASPLSKILVAFAGPFMNVVFAFVIAAVIYLVGLPELVNPPFVGPVDADSPEAKMGIREGDKVLSVNGEPVKSWQDMQSITMLALTNVLPVVVEREGKTNLYYLTAKVNEDAGVTVKLLNLVPRAHPVIHRVVANGPAEKAGLKKDDEVISFGGIPVLSPDQLIKLIKKNGNIPTDVGIWRAKQKMTIKVTPMLDPDKNCGRIQAEIGSSSKMDYIEKRPGPTPWAQIVDVWQKTVSTIQALFHSKQSGVGISDLSGPPGILAMLAAQIKTDFRLALSFLVLLNINLAILNLLPIPVLDGGHIAIALVESAIRRPIHVRVLEYTTTAFAVLLISFMLYVSFNDFLRFKLFKSMFQSEVRIEKQEKTPADKTEPVLAPSPAPAK